MFKFIDLTEICIDSEIILSIRCRIKSISSKMASAGKWMSLFRCIALKSYNIPLNSVNIFSGGNVQKITYKTSNKAIATVSNKGVITAKKPGKVKITVQAGTKKFVVTVTVKK